jgi:hypothetical protein
MLLRTAKPLAEVASGPPAFKLCPLCYVIVVTSDSSPVVMPLAELAALKVRDWEVAPSAGIGVFTAVMLRPASILALRIHKLAIRQGRLSPAAWTAFANHIPLTLWTLHADSSG